jgi:hypothetical protein
MPLSVFPAALPGSGCGRSIAARPMPVRVEASGYSARPTTPAEILNRSPTL